MPTNGKKRSGRPPKFKGPRRPVTVTLPETTLSRLASINSDRAQAIVSLAESHVPQDFGGKKSIEIVEVTPGVGIIIVGPSKLLRRIDGLQLVELAAGRYLLAILPGTSMDALELAIADVLEDADAGDEWELSNIKELRDLIRALRRRSAFSRAEMIFVDTNTLDGKAKGSLKKTG